jgi:hypothetical protein
MSTRRTAADAREGVRALVEQLGRRAPTSLAEAAAAAHVNGQLRQAGLRVSADPFRLPAPSRAGALLPGLLGLIVAALLAPLPLPSLLLAVWALVVSGLLPLLGAPPLLARWAESQNVVGVRAANAARTWRVVLLARLDSAPAPRGLARLAAPTRSAAAGRAVAFAALAALAALAYAGGPLPWAPLAAIPAAYLLLVSIVALRPVAAPAESAGAGALAVLLGAASQLVGLHEVELWAIALGAAREGGAATLLKRYPFERDTTLLIALDSLDAGRLVVVSPKPGLGRRTADPLLLALAAHAADQQTTAAVVPQPLPATAAAAQARGLRVVALTADGDAPAAAPDDRLGGIDGQLVDKATRLVVAMVRQLDEGFSPPNAIRE